MVMTPRLRKFAITVHVLVSVGWLGAVVAYLALAIVGLTSQDPSVARACYRSMALIGPFVIIPFSLATLLSGVIEAVGTRWGVFQHWWVVAKLGLTALATVILLRHMTAVISMALVAADATVSLDDFRAQRLQLIVHAIGGVLVLLTTTALSIYKPLGLTPFARRNEPERVGVLFNELPSPIGIPRVARPAVSTGAPRWVYVIWIHAIGLGVLFVVMHLAGGGFRGH
jgi:hypothetical protein